MCSYISKQDLVFSDLEGDTIIHVDAQFPDRAGSFHLLDPEGWMRRVLQEQFQLVIEHPTDLGQQSGERLLERL